MRTEGGGGSKALRTLPDTVGALCVLFSSLSNGLSSEAAPTEVALDLDLVGFP